MFPQIPKLRVAAWAVVQGHSGEPGTQVECFAGGPLHGLWQTSGRAEIVAVLAAVRLGVRSGRRTRIWSDCANVVNRLLLLLDDPQCARPNAHDADLWDLLAIELRREHHITVHKVAAHVDERVYGPVEEWARRFNDMADQYAKSFNLQRTDEFWQSWNLLRAQMQQAEAVGQYVLQLHCLIGEEAIRLHKGSPTQQVGT